MEITTISPVKANGATEQTSLIHHPPRYPPLAPFSHQFRGGRFQVHGKYGLVNYPFIAACCSEGYIFRALIILMYLSSKSVAATREVVIICLNI